MPLLDAWERSEFAADGRTFEVFRRGSGPGVVVLPELPGVTREVVAFAEEVVAAGFTVVIARLFGRVGAGDRAVDGVRTFAEVCLSREFTKLATGVTTPVAGWLRALCRDLHASAGGPGVGVVGMCFTGGFALAAMADPSVTAPVLAQPAVPFPLGRRRSADVNLSAPDLETVKARVAAGCPVLGLRFVDDIAVGRRFDTLRRELGDGFEAVEFPGRKHSVLTLHRQQAGVDRVVAFLRERLQAAP